MPEQLSITGNFSNPEIPTARLYLIEGINVYMCIRVLTDAHFLCLARNNRKAELPKLTLLRPRGCTFVIMGYKFNSRELLEVADIKR